MVGFAAGRMGMPFTEQEEEEMRAWAGESTLRFQVSEV